MIAHEATKISGFGAEIAAQISERRDRLAGGSHSQGRRLRHAVPLRAREHYLPHQKGYLGDQEGLELLSSHSVQFEFKLPDIGEGIAEGEILKWLVKEGEPVKEDQSLVEVMTDKVNVQIPSPRDGTITKILAKEGRS